MATATQNIAQSNIATSTNSRDSSFLRSARVLWFGIALLVFGISTFFAHRQAPRPDPFQPVQPLTTLDWWQYPLERNAFKRLPVITSDLNDVFALPNSKKVWAVGDEGMIVHSEDGGETWVQQEVNWEAMADSQFTQTSRVQEQQQIDPKQAILTGQQEQNSLHSNSFQKGSNFAFVQEVLRKRPERAIPMELKTGKLNSVHIAEASRGWVVGDEGAIFATEDGGQTWNSFHLPTYKHFTPIGVCSLTSFF